MTITMEEARTWKMRERAHYNGGKEWFGYGHQGIEQPRLYRIDRYMRKDRSVVSEWQVDGEKVDSFEAAVDRLNTPPVLSNEERAFLAEVPDDWAPCKEVRALPVTGDNDVHHVTHYLDRKGLIEASNGKCRRTELARELLARGGRALS